jgi:hypothetical protein
MDEAAERLHQEALHPARRAGRIWLEPAETGDGSEILCFGGNGNTAAVQLTQLDLDELAGVLLARRGLTATWAAKGRMFAGILSRGRFEDRFEHAGQRIEWTCAHEHAGSAKAVACARAELASRGGLT